MTNSSTLKLLKEILDNSTPDNWKQSRTRIEADATHLDQMLKSSNPPRIYGANTLVGHMDETLLDKEEIETFQRHLIENHSLGIEPYYSDFESRCIGYTKLHLLSLGGSGITLELYDKLIETITDHTFTPKIPNGSTYSCGDVIPAAHWVKSLLNFWDKKQQPYQLKRKEGLALINGVFVHVGLAIAQLITIRSLWQSYLWTSKINAQVCFANPSNFTPLLSLHDEDLILDINQYILRNLQKQKTYKRQDPISIRAFPQIAAAFGETIKEFISSIEETMWRRSDNPLILFEDDSPLSQASFIAPRITFATSQLIEAILMTMWSIDRRIHHLLSGEVEGIPINGSQQSNNLGFIQIPKLSTAILEEARLHAGRRSFASGSTTSYGIEDMWSFGVDTLEVLNSICDKFCHLLAIESIVLYKCNRSFQDGTLVNQFPLTNLHQSNDLPLLFAEMRNLIINNKLPHDEDFPLHSFLF